jgi:hypothetical protein
MDIAKKVFTIVLVLLALNYTFPKIFYGQEPQYYSKQDSKPEIRESEIEIRSTPAEKITKDKGKKSSRWLWGLLAIIVAGGAAAFSLGGGGGDDDSNDPDTTPDGGSGTVTW